MYVKPESAFVWGFIIQNDLLIFKNLLELNEKKSNTESYNIKIKILTMFVFVTDPLLCFESDFIFNLLWSMNLKYAVVFIVCLAIAYEYGSMLIKLNTYFQPNFMTSRMLIRVCNNSNITMIYVEFLIRTFIVCY